MTLALAQTLHVCHVCLHWGGLGVNVGILCIYIYHTWSVWVEPTLQDTTGVTSGFLQVRADTTPGPRHDPGGTRVLRVFGLGHVFMHRGAWKKGTRIAHPSEVFWRRANFSARLAARPDG